MFFASILKKPSLLLFYTILFLLINLSLCMADVFMAPKDASPERCDNGPGTRFSWRDYASSKGVRLAPIRDQGHCGSCWAFAPINAMEDILALNNINIDLSREVLVGDCGCDGSCNGGYTEPALEFLEVNGTFDAQDDSSALFYDDHGCYLLFIKLYLCNCRKLFQKLQIFVFVFIHISKL